MSFLLLYVTCRISALLQRRKGRRGTGRRLIYCSEYDQKGAGKANTSCCCPTVKTVHTASTDSQIGENISNMHTVPSAEVLWEREGSDGDGERDKQKECTVLQPVYC